MDDEDVLKMACADGCGAKKGEPCKPGCPTGLGPQSYVDPHDGMDREEYEYLKDDDPLGLGLTRWQRLLAPLQDFSIRYVPYDAFYGRGTGETERTLAITWCWRRITISWMGPLRRSAKRRQLREYEEFDAKVARMREYN